MPEESSGDPLVLCYHAISEEWPADLAVTPERFERQLESLLERGYRGTTFARAVSEPPAGKVVAVTFDDGYRSVIERAFPVMRRLGIPGTVFVVTGWLGQARPLSWPGIDQWVGGPHEHELQPLSLDDLRFLTDEGWEIGSHTRNHPRLTELDQAQLERELRGSREDCECALRVPCHSIAYPYGDVNAAAVAAAGRAGYSAGATLPERFEKPVPLARPRVGIYRSDTDRRFALKISPLVRRLRRLRAWTVADRIRSIAGDREGS